jgi:hypothetical protein
VHHAKWSCEVFGEKKKIDKLNKRPFEGLGVDLRVILKCTLNKIWRCGLGLYKSRNTSGILSCELCNEHLGPWQTGNTLTNWRITASEKACRLSRRELARRFMDRPIRREGIPFACSFMLCFQIFSLYCVRSELIVVYLFFRTASFRGCRRF